jgi:predicted GTPase
LISVTGKIFYPAFVSNLIAIVGRPNAGKSAPFYRVFMQ